MNILIIYKSGNPTNTNVKYARCTDKELLLRDNIDAPSHKISLDIIEKVHISGDELDVEFGYILESRLRSVNYCRKCDTKWDEKAEYCHKCGNKR